MAWNCRELYYPKLVSAIPFTPATGSKFLSKRQASEEQRDVIKTTSIAGLSSAHHVFIPPAEINFFTRQGFFIRNSFQYHWNNKNYADFDGFLNDLKGKRRREVIRERAQVTSQGLEIKLLTGDQLTSFHAEIMHHFYQSTMDKKQGFEFLTAEFFRVVFETIKDKILLVLAFHDDRPVAGALNFIGSDTLFGRYWGCLAEYRALHFEVCYYQGIEFKNELNCRASGGRAGSIPL